VASIRRYLTAGRERRWEVRWRDPSGRERCKTFNREWDAKRYRVDVERKQQLGPLYDARPELFGDFERGWFERHQQKVGPATFVRAQQVRRHLREFEPLYVQQVTARDVEDCIVAVARTAPRQAQMALALVKQILRTSRPSLHNDASSSTCMWSLSATPDLCKRSNRHQHRTIRKIKAGFLELSSRTRADSGRERLPYSDGQSMKNAKRVSSHGLYSRR